MRGGFESILKCSKHFNQLRDCSAQSVDHDDRSTFLKHLVEIKIAVSLRNLVSAPCSETGLNLRTSLFVDHWL